MNFIAEHLLQLSAMGWLIFAVVVVLAIYFVALFFVPGILLWFHLRRVQAQIHPPKAVGSIEEFERPFKTDRQLHRLWKEYKKSLRRLQSDEGGKATYRTIEPAEMYFNGQMIVDNRLRTEFFKHLPGILTGTGIIGTFSGLIGGLGRFRVTENATTVRNSLELLMHDVSGAFFVSAIAIGVAMLATLLEKLLLAALYRKVEDIAQAIDLSFTSSVSEEYQRLEQIAKATEESASQLKQLKDSMIGDLKDLLIELTDKQIQAGQQQQDALASTLGSRISQSITESLQTPLDKIADSVQKASGDQSDAASRLLQDVLVSFSQKLEDIFGGQISGITQLNQETAQGIEHVRSALDALVGRMEASSQKLTNEMAERMAQAVSETNQNLQGALGAIGKQMGDMLEKLDASQQQVFAANREREQEMVGRASRAVSDMSASVDSVVQQLGAAAQQMAHSVDALGQAAASSINGMNEGAARLGNAAQDFATAGNRVSGVMGQAADVSTKLSETSEGLIRGADAIQSVLKDYQNQRATIVQLVTELGKMVEAAHQEAALTDAALIRIRESADHLGAAQKQADDYLAGVNQVLATVNEEFAKAVRNTLKTVNTEFHDKLSQAVSLLSGSIQDLEAAVTLAPRSSTSTSGAAS